jgi:hypothetical protein
VSIIRYLDITVWGMMAVEVVISCFVFRWWRQLNRSGRLTGGWILAATVFAIGGQIGKYTIRNSLVVTFYWYPISALLAFNALAFMHAPGRSRKSLHVLSIAVVIAWAILALTIEQRGDFSRLTSPMHAVLLAAAGAYTMITRVETSRVDLLRDPAFVVAAFWVIYAIPTVFLSVAARYWMVQRDAQTLLNFYSFRNSVVVLSYAILVYGLWLFAKAPRRGHATLEGTVTG